jgi:CBS-domain-containing membrane protein
MLTKVGQVMTTDVATVREDAVFADIAAQLLGWHISALPVVDAANRVVGVVSEGDLLVKEARWPTLRSGARPPAGAGRSWPPPRRPAT